MLKIVPFLEEKGSRLTHPLIRVVLLFKEGGEKILFWMLCGVVLCKAVSSKFPISEIFSFKIHSSIFAPVACAHFEIIIIQFTSPFAVIFFLSLL